MTGSHPDIGPELRQLAQTILDRLDPAVRLAAARAAGSGAGKCQQVWCPVCALAVIRAIIEDTADTGGPTPPEPPEAPPPSGPPGGDEPPPAGPGRYQHIPV